jgi:hypothetical protein
LKLSPFRWITFVQDLRERKIGTLSRDDYLHLKTLTEDARVLSRIAFERHVIEHGCQEPEP